MKNFLATKVPKDTQMKIDILLAEMIVMDNLPLTVLPRDGFWRIFSFIAPTYNIPSYEKIRDTIIPSIYARTAVVVKTVLKSCDVVTIMLDLWSSNSMVGFMGVSCSSVTADYVPFTCFLNMKEMPSNHTAEAILSESECVVSDWELNGKVVVFIKWVLFRPVLFAGPISSGPISTGPISPPIGVRRSVVDTKVLLDSVGFKIPMMNLTRWNSQFLMVKHFLNGIDIDTALQSKLNACKAHGSLSSLQLKCLKEFVTLLEPFKIATDVFQKDTETIGLVIPFYLDLVNQCSLDPRVNQEAKFITSCKCMAEELSRIRAGPKN
ncbi:uncharacterized protein LOC123475567 [Daphnia magna]|uniref:uncharacterized protein LOC123475567 n=1 Tax=Daphnia magna TaxID=35525 RepID=UPI001E1BCB44|nr:uncharacterized protein LOC123475567 [Daphnia magna]